MRIIIQKINRESVNKRLFREEVVGIFKPILSMITYIGKYLVQEYKYTYCNSLNKISYPENEGMCIILSGFFDEWLCKMCTGRHA